MADLNKVFLMGRLTFDPELRRTPSGTAVAELRMATSRSWSGRDGERREETLFVDVTVWDRQAENCCQYLRKGSPIHVEGYLKMDNWEDKNTGEKRSKIRVQAERVQFLDSRRSDAGSGASGGGDDDEYSSGASSSRDYSAGRGASPSARSGGGRSAESSGPTGAPPPAARHAVEDAPNGSPDAEEDDIPF
jgi:single-strand DNA-binding protein